MRISIWDDAAKPGETGEIVVYGGTPVAEKICIKDMLTSTGKSNVYNSVNDIF